MKTKIWFNIKRITKITLSYEREAKRTFYPSEPRGRFKFLWLIPLWKKEDYPDRWVDDRWVDDNGYIVHSEYENDDRYRIQDLPKKLFVKPTVHVQLDYKDKVSSYFDTDQEAEEFVELILSQTDHQFEVIKRK